MLQQVYPPNVERRLAFDASILRLPKTSNRASEVCSERTHPHGATSGLPPHLRASPHQDIKQRSSNDLQSSSRCLPSSALTAPSDGGIAAPSA
eukprot:2219848-Amphidinium_carterae.1